MEDSTKSIIWTVATIFIFIIAVVNFAILFPLEQGFEFSGEDEKTYATISSSSSTGETSSNLEIIEGDLELGYKNWDTEAGFMGSNQQKASGVGIKNYVTQVLDSIKLLTKGVFSTGDDSTHPFMWVIGAFTALLGVYSFLVLVEWIRRG